MFGTKKCPYCRELIFKKAIICKHCKSDLTKKIEVKKEESSIKSDLTERSEPIKIKPKKKEGPTYSEKMKAAIEEEKAKQKAHFESLSPEEKELYLKEKKRKWKVNTFWAVIGFTAIYFYGLSAINMWLSWLAFLIFLIGIWLYPRKGEEVFFKNRLKKIKVYKGRIVSTLTLFVVTLIIFIPLASEAMEEKRIQKEEEFIENYPAPTIKVLSSVGHQGDAKEYELEVRVEEATSVYADDKEMAQDLKDKSLYKLTIPLDQYITENIDIEAENEYKEATEQIVITRNETEEEKTQRIAQEAKEKEEKILFLEAELEKKRLVREAEEEKKKEEERIAEETRIEQERLSQEAEAERQRAEKEQQDTMIKENCASKWPEDFSMRSYCEGNQYDGLNTLNKGKPEDINESEFDTIRKNCTSKWPEDFSMRAYCEENQYEAVRELR